MEPYGTLYTQKNLLNLKKPQGTIRNPIEQERALLNHEESYGTMRSLGVIRNVVELYSVWSTHIEPNRTIWNDIDLEGTKEMIQKKVLTLCKLLYL